MWMEDKQIILEDVRGGGSELCPSGFCGELMSLSRPFIWECDDPGCDAVETKDGYGLPTGWTWSQKLIDKVRHFCPACTQKAKDEKKEGLQDGQEN